MKPFFFSLGVEKRMLLIALWPWTRAQHRCGFAVAFYLEEVLSLRTRPHPIATLPSSLYLPWQMMTAEKKVLGEFIRFGIISNIRKSGAFLLF
ncbi:hypothetical protein BKA65DRAFT_145266 [Rhexocercosporidium sp. MPI-PUGE-AT-0058]|nr:hypothetical protein BKA65DRAFT_145266 [Rhexocercosporidium sp. MPI-PUGE-AT-0058]